MTQRQWRLSRDKISVPHSNTVFRSDFFFLSWGYARGTRDRMALIYLPKFRPPIRIAVQFSTLVLPALSQFTTVKTLADFWVSLLGVHFAKEETVPGTRLVCPSFSQRAKLAKSVCSVSFWTKLIPLSSLDRINHFHVNRLK